MNRTFLAGVLVAALALPCAAITQDAGNSPRISAGGVVGYDWLFGFKLPTGADLVHTEWGYALEGQVRYTTGGRLAFGAGVLYERYGSADAGPYESFSVLGFYFEPRYLIVLQKSNVTPFIGGRVAWAERRMNNSFVDARGSPIPGTDLKSRGRGLGIIGGLVFPLSPRIGIEAAVVFTRRWFGDWSLTRERNSPEDCPRITTGNAWGGISAKGTVCNSGESGSFVGPRLGLMVNF